MQVLLAEEYGFCFGVERAVEMVEGALAGGATVRTLGPLIHNTQEIQRLEAGGVRTIDTPGEVEEGITAVISAPLVVSQTTLKLSTFLEAAEAVRARADAEPQVVNTICSATRDRQTAARDLAGHVDVFYIIGGRHSSNSIKLLSVCREQCPKSYLIETPDEINAEDLRGARRVGVT